MKIYVLPISGGHFVSQLGLLCEIYEATHHKNGKPDLVLSSSGGNIASYISMSGGWNSSNIYHNIESVNSSLFVYSWAPFFIPTWIFFPFTKTLYRIGEGFTNIFKDFFTPVSIKQTEIWTGTYNVTKKCGTLFCNLSENESKLKTHVDKDIFDVNEPRFMDGNLELAANVCYASAAVPLVTENVKIGEDYYCDGGLSYSSPLIPLSTKILKFVSSNDNKFQLTYISSYNMDLNSTDSLYAQTIGPLIHSSALQDRAFAVSMLQKFTSVIKEPIFYNNIKNSELKDIYDRIENISYVLFLYPNEENMVNITNFSAVDIKTCMTNVRKNYSGILWTS